MGQTLRNRTCPSQKVAEGATARGQQQQQQEPERQQARQPAVAIRALSFNLDERRTHEVPRCVVRGTRPLDTPAAAPPAAAAAADSSASSLLRHVLSGKAACSVTCPPTMGAACSA